MKAVGIIDLQKDFVNPDGALYVPGAEKIKTIIYNNMNKLANQKDVFVFATMDAHDGTEPEMKHNGGLFPFHCMKGTPGQELIDEVKNPLCVNEMMIFEKACYNVFDKEFGNQYIEKILKSVNVDSVILFGVVGNICVEAAALGLRKLNIEVELVEDSIVWMDISPDNNEKVARERLIAAGCKFIPTLPE